MNQFRQGNQKKKVAFFHFGFFYEGGGERLVLEQMAGLKEKGFEPVCFTPIYQPKVCYPSWIEDFKIKVLVPQWLNWFAEGLTIQMLTASWLIVFQFWRFLDFDCFIGIGQPGAWMAFCLSKLLNKPYLVWMNQPTRFLHPRPIDLKSGLRISDKKGIAHRTVKLLKPLVSALDEVSVRRADVLMCNSRFIAKWLKKAYQKKVVQNYPGGDSILTSGLSKPAKIPQPAKERFNGFLRLKTRKISQPFVLLTNRHFPQKKFDYALKMAPALNKAFPELKLVITGRKNLHTKQLEKLSRRLGVEEKVVFTGSVDEKDLARLYSQAALYFYLAPQEDFGMGIVEAMFAGIPVIAWDEAGPKETVVSGQTGFLIEPYDLKAFEKQAARLLKNKSLNQKMGRAGLKRAEKKFSWQKHVKILKDQLEALI